MSSWFSVSTVSAAVLLCCIVFSAAPSQADVNADFVKLDQFVRGQIKPSNASGLPRRAGAFINLDIHGRHLDLESKRLRLAVLLQMTYREPRLLPWDVQKHPFLRTFVDVVPLQPNVGLQPIVNLPADFHEVDSTTNAHFPMRLLNNGSVQVLALLNVNLPCYVAGNLICNNAFVIETDNVTIQKEEHVILTLREKFWEHLQTTVRSRRFRNNNETHTRVWIRVTFQRQSYGIWELMKAVAVITALFVVGQFLLLTTNNSSRVLFHLLLLGAQFQWIHTLEEFPIFSSSSASADSTPSVFILYMALMGLQCVALAWSVVLQCTGQGEVCRIPNSLRAGCAFFRQVLCCSGPHDLHQRNAVLSASDTLGSVYWGAMPNDDLVEPSSSADVFEAITSEGGFSTVISDGTDGDDKSLFISFGMLFIFLDRCWALVMAVICIALFCAYF